jgi:hypothetical protein
METGTRAFADASFLVGVCFDEDVSYPEGKCSLVSHFTHEQDVCKPMARLRES